MDFEICAHAEKEHVLLSHAHLLKHSAHRILKLFMEMHNLNDVHECVYEQAIF